MITYTHSIHHPFQLPTTPHLIRTGGSSGAGPPATSAGGCWLSSCAQRHRAVFGQAAKRSSALRNSRATWCESNKLHKSHTKSLGMEDTTQILLLRVLLLGFELSIFWCCMAEKWCLGRRLNRKKYKRLIVELSKGMAQCHTSPRRSGPSLVNFLQDNCRFHFHCFFQHCSNIENTHTISQTDQTTSSILRKCKPPKIFQWHFIAFQTFQSLIYCFFQALLWYFPSSQQDQDLCQMFQVLEALDWWHINSNISVPASGYSVYRTRIHQVEIPFLRYSY